MKTKKEVLAMVNEVSEAKENALYFEDFLKQCAVGGVIPFIGAGLSVNLGFPLWRDLLLNMGARATIQEEINTMLRALDYEGAASLVKEKLGLSVFNRMIEEAYGDHRLPAGKISGAIESLTRFRAGPIITTNFDRLIETSFERSGKNIETVWRLHAEPASRALQQGLRVLLKLHGDWAASDRVLTSEDYQATYGSLNTDEIDWKLEVPNLLRIFLASRTLLFVGCSLAQDRTMRVLAAAVKIFGFRHYALLSLPSDPSVFVKRKQELSNLGIFPIWFLPEKRDVFIVTFLEFLATKSNEPYISPHSTRRVIQGLNAQVDSIVGRNEEIEDICGLLNGFRLLTIVGGAGCGKSRVAMEIADKLSDLFEERVWFVELADLSPKADQEDLLPPRIGRVCGVLQQPSRPPLDALAEHFANDRHLLILDNCEHLIPSCSFLIRELLGRCPGLIVLTTSRRRLNLREEQLYPLEPLGIPRADATEVNEILQNESVILFSAFARKHNPKFKADASNARPLSDLCRILDGIPLALEIAAARVNSRSIEQISKASKSLAADLAKFEGTVSIDDLRHWHTLSAALEWSYTLLTEPAQKLFRILTVFDGGWTDATAQAVSAPFERAESVTTLLEELVENSLTVSRDINGTKRFRLLEPVRQFIRGKLTPDEIKAYDDQHAEVFAQMAESAAPEFLKANQAYWLAQIQEEADNFRAAMRWTTAKPDSQTALRIAASIWRFLEIRGYFKEGRTRLKEIILLPGNDIFPKLFQQVLEAAGWLAYRQADYADADILIRRALDLSEHAGDLAGIANALNDLGTIATIRGRFAEAESNLLRCLEIQKQLENSRMIHVALFNLGSSALAQGKFDEAIRYLTESVQGFKNISNHRDSAFPLRSLGELACHQKQIDVAKAYASESLKIRTELKDIKGRAETLCTLARIEFAAGNSTSALSHLKESLNVAKNLGDVRTLVDGLELAAHVKFSQGAVPLSVEFIAAAERFRKSVGYVLYPVLRLQYNQHINEARFQLGTIKFEGHWHRGASHDLHSLIEATCESPKAVGNL